MNKGTTFVINGMGSLKIIASLLTVDYPRIFIAKTEENNPLLFIFEEIAVNDSVAMWAVSQITFGEFDGLNRGLRTVQDCYRGPRGEKRKGYRVTAYSNKNGADSEPVSDIFPLIKDGAFYPDPFVDEQHGAGLLSLVYETKFISTVLDSSSFAPPLISSTRAENAIAKAKEMLASLPFSLKTKNVRASLSYGHSIVLNIELSDKEKLPAFSLAEPSEMSESSDASKALEVALSPSGTEVDVMNAFKGDKDAIKKCQSFVKEMRRNNPNGNTIFQIVDTKGGLSNSVIINKENDKLIQRKLSESIKGLETAIKKENNFVCSGVFLMLDTTGKMKFKFQSTSPNGSKNLYVGFSSKTFNSNNLKLILRDYSYTATIEETIYEGVFGATKPVYRLINLAEADNYKQEFFLKDS